MTKLAVKLDGGELQGLGGYHYMLHPFPMAHDSEAAVYELMGYEIIEVDDDRAKQLCDAAHKALLHQAEVALLVEKQRHAKPEA